MFNESGSNIGYNSENPEHVPSPVENILERLKKGKKDEDWQTIIDVLEGLPRAEHLSEKETADIFKSLSKLRKIVDERTAAGRIFSGDSLEDLSEKLEAILKVKEQEFEQ